MDIIVKLVRNLINITYEDIPSEVISVTKKSILDTLGAILIGTGTRCCKEVIGLICEWGGRKQSTIINYGMKVPLYNAVFANCMMARAMELDDVHEKATLHPSATSVPTAFAVAECIGKISGRDLLAAVTLGNDLVCRMGLAPNLSPAITGLSYTYTLGGFAGVAVTGKLMEFDEEKILNGMGIAYSQAAGNRQAFVEGASIIQVQQGLTGKIGVISALLADRGITGAKNILEGKYGYYKVLERNDYDPDILIKDLGKKFEGVNVSFKHFPCCKFAHGAIEAVLSIVNKYNIEPYEISEVDVKINKQMYELLCEPIEEKYKPSSSISAKFSMYYSLATAIVRRSVFVDDYTDEAVRDTKVLKMARKVKCDIDPELEKINTTGISPTRVEIKLKNGREYTKQVDFVKGHPNNPVSFEDISKKVRQCAKYAVNSLIVRELEGVIDAVRNLEQVEDVKQIIKILHH